MKKIIGEINVTYEKKNTLDEVTGKKPDKIIIGNDTYQVKSFADVLTLISGISAQYNKSKFEEVCPTIKGRKRAYFDKDKTQLYKGRKIENTDYFVEINNSGEICMKICVELLEKINFEHEVYIEFIN